MRTRDPRPSVPAPSPHQSERSLFPRAPEPPVAVGLDTRNVGDGHGERFLDGPVRAEAPQLARLPVVARAVPDRAVDTRDAGHEAIGVERLDDLARLRVDLVDA